MFRIRRVYDAILAINKEAISQVESMLKTQIYGDPSAVLTGMVEQLRNPMKYSFRSILFVADDSRGHVKGFALLQHAADLNFCYLDYLSAEPKRTGRGIGGALYGRVREEASLLGSVGLFFECLPDDPDLCRNPETLKQNAARLRFYENYGARPIANTAYETPLSSEDDCPPYIVFDNLEQETALARERARLIVRAILERKYSDVCPKEYIAMVVDSFVDDPVRIRPPRYLKRGVSVNVSPKHSVDNRIALVVNDKHEIHHVADRGYVEAPVRIDSILREILPGGLFEQVEARRFSEDHIKAVHQPGFVNYLRRVCANVPANQSVYPYIFPIRNAARPPKELPVRAGYYCIDTFTPLNQNAYLAARRAVDCTLTAASGMLEGRRIAYALVRPPGHHAEQNAFGGFCYFNSAAVAAHFLSKHGKVSILDIDYHHGNGQQDIFYGRSDVQTISIHGHPRFAYPYFSGFADEIGVGEGVGFNLNFPLPEYVDGTKYREVLTKAVKLVARFQPQFLIIALGLDTAKGDPTGTWNLNARDFEVNGAIIGTLGLPLLVVQEGGYKVRSLGTNVRNFFVGLWNGSR